MLKTDADFTPCPIHDGDELFRNGFFVFNITRMLEYLKKNPDEIDCVGITVSDFRKEFSSIDESHVESVDISRPVVLAEIYPGYYNLIDGNHRMEKARRSGKIKMWAYKLKMHQHIAFLTSKKAYLSYVEYWNGKLKQLRRQEKDLSLEANASLKTSMGVVLNKQELLITLKQIEKYARIPGLTAGKFYSFIGVDKYSGRGRFNHLKGESVAVIQSGERKRSKIMLFLDPLLLMVNADIDEIQYGKLPYDYIEKYRTGEEPGIPNLYDYESHYKAIARYITNLIEV